MEPEKSGERVLKPGRIHNMKRGMAFAAVLSGAVLFIVVVFFCLYRSSRQNLENLWQTNTVQIAHDLENYLNRPVDAVEFSARHVEEMMRDGADNKEIGDYLVHETEVVSALVDSNTTGIYGYIRGEYLDGSGWIPALTYQPTQRPWYQEALAAKGETALVRPFVNFQTRSMTMSVSRLLADGESVISMDIHMDGAQRLMEEMERKEQVDAAMVLDSHGCVIVHSDEKEIGKNYMNEDGDCQCSLAKKVLEGKEGVYHLKGPEGRQIAFTRQVNKEWYSVLVVRYERLFGPLRYIFVCSALAVICVVLGLTLLYLGLSRRRRETEQLSREIQAAAEVFEAMYLIDLKADRIRALRPSPLVEQLLGGSGEHCRSSLRMLARDIADPDSLEAVERFLTLDDLDQRMGNRRFVSLEFLTSTERWMRLRYVPVERDEDGHLCQILCAAESIEEERRQQERLRRLAETDPLTKIRNRSSGEAQVRARMDEGLGGMFLLLDVDHFKSVNDQLGHNVGDQVIVAVANCVRATFRGTDVVFRLGGDEFAAFAPSLTGREQAERLVERLFSRVREIHIPALRGRVITVSVGVTFTRPEGVDSFESLYRRSDEGMYRSKQSKGNQATYV